MVQYIRYIFWVFVWIIGFSCQDKKKNEVYPAIDVIGYLKGQLKTLDSVPYGLLKITELGGQKPDSVYLTKQQFISHVTPFLHPSIDKAHLESDYDETSFADAGLGYIIITYQSKGAQNPIDQIVLYIKPEQQTIHQVYITGHLNPDKENEKKQLLWMHDKGCTIFTTRDHQTEASTGLTERIIWQ
jgi:hypothetical protein